MLSILAAKRMWKLSWKKKLRSVLADEAVKRIVVLGMGNELDGDDAAGIKVARLLKTALADCSHVLVIDGGNAPESYTGKIRQFGPDFVLLVDGADMDEAPGTVALLDWEDTDGLSGSTHTLPLHVLSNYLVLEFGCQVALLGIQIQQLNMTLGDPLSPPVAAAVDEVVGELCKA
jgi:hydrogenase 3 maturation protease